MSDANEKASETPESPEQPQAGGAEAPENGAQPAEVVQDASQEQEAPADPQAARIAELEAELGKSREQLLRTAADFDNYRKRARRDVEEAQRKATEKVLLEMLPVADNLERALASTGPDTPLQSVVEGVQMVLKGFEDTFSRLGVERVPAMGEAFDPNLHEAIQQLETDQSPPGTVVSELTPGYKLGDRLLRAALVVVAKPPKTEG